MTRSHRAPIVITSVSALALVIVAAFHVDISAARDVFCDSLYRDAGLCRGERFLDPSPFAIWLPADLFVWDSLHAGNLPLWERLQGGGYSPLLVVYGGVFHPLRWLAALFPRNVYPSALIVLAFYLGFLGMFLTARQNGSSATAALLAAFSFTFGGAVVSLAHFSGAMLPVAQLPWLVFFLRRASVTRRMLDFVALSAALALTVVAGHPSFVFLSALAMAGMGLTDSVTWRTGRPLLVAAASAVTAALLSAFVTIPPLLARGELWDYKTRTYFGSSYGILQMDKWMRTVYAAAFQHRYQYLDTDFWMYIGVPAIVLALAGLYASFRVTRHLGVMALLFAFLMVAFPGPWMVDVADLPPVKYLKSWYAIGCAAFFLALAVAVGFDHLRGGGVRARSLAAGFALWIGAVYGWRAWMALDPVRWRDLPGTAPFAFLHAQPRPFRITGMLGQTHTPNSSRITGIEDVRTSQPILLQRYVTWWSLVDRDARRRAFPTTRITDRLTSPLVARFGVEYVLQSRLATWLTFHSDPDPAKRDRELSPYLATFPLVMRTPSLEIRRNPRPISPRAHFAARVVVVPDARAAEAAMPSDAAVVESTTTALSLPALARGSVVLRYPSDSRVEMDVESQTGGLVVLHDAYSSGWTATVDGKPASVLPVDILSRGVAAPPGRHRIEMRYMPAGFVAGCIISAMTAAGLTALLWWRRAV